MMGIITLNAKNVNVAHLSLNYLPVSITTIAQWSAK